MQYQVTLNCVSGKYKPVSTIVDTDLDITTHKQEIINKGIQKICIQRNWTKTDVKKYEYLKCKIRVYDKKKIEQENKERYERIKEEKYTSGEWKRPKGEK